MLLLTQISLTPKHLFKPYLANQADIV